MRAQYPVGKIHPRPGVRYVSVDALRGLIMILMAVDHASALVARQHGVEFWAGAMSAYDSAFPFLTRWITHVCAPVFVFLAGTGAFLTGARGRSKTDLSRFLLIRGLWLVLPEVTVINAEWLLSWKLSNLFGQVIWALGWSMCVLAGLIHLPLAAIAAFGWGMIALHDLTNGLTSATFGPLGWLWTILHVPGSVPWAGGNFGIIYPLVPWIGVMAAGYAFGPWLQRPDAERRRLVMRLGLLLTAAFVLLRGINLYGDPRPWAPRPDAVFTALSFLNGSKYPPSLLFLLMTLGPSLILLAAVDRGVPRALRWMVVFGRVPLFYYVLHLALIDVVTIGFAIGTYGSRTAEIFAKGPPRDWGYGLPVVYLINHVGFALYAGSAGREGGALRAFAIDVPARVILFFVGHAAIYASSARMFGSFGGDAVQALHAVVDPPGISQGETLESNCQERQIAVAALARNVHGLPGPVYDELRMGRRLVGEPAWSESCAASET